MRALRGLVIASIAVACGSSSSGDDSDIGLPGRNADAGEPVDASLPPPPPPADAGHDAGPPSICNEPNLLLCLPFENDTVDGSPQAFAPTAKDNLTFIAGVVGQAAFFGQATALRYPPSTLFNVTQATVEAWIRRDTNAGTSVVFDADQRFSMQVLGAQLKCASAGGASTTGGTVPLQKWTHVACVFDGQKILLYVDGIQRDMDTGKPQTSATGSEAVGGNAPSGNPFVGGIDSLRVFKAARTPEQIAAAAKP